MFALLDCPEKKELKQNQKSSSFTKTKIPRKYFNFGSNNYEKNPFSKYAQLKRPAGNHRRAYEIASTVVEILTPCGIDSVKAKKSFDIILFSFIRFNRTSKGKLKIRKDYLIKNLQESCKMTKTEAKTTYVVAKAGFKELFRSEISKKYDGNFTVESDWDKAFQETVETYVKTGMPIKETERVLKVLENSYVKYMRRRHIKKHKSLESCEIKAPCQCLLKEKEVPKQETNEINFYTCLPQPCSLCKLQSKPVDIHICDHKIGDYNRKYKCKARNRLSKKEVLKNKCLPPLKKKVPDIEASCILRSKRIICSKVIGLNRPGPADPTSCICEILDAPDSFTSDDSDKSSTSTPSCLSTSVNIGSQNSEGLACPELWSKRNY